MVSPIILQDVLDRMNDLVSNYTTGAIDVGNRIRAANSAIEYVKRRMTLPSDELIQRFYFYQDTYFYNLNQDFNEGLFVLYDNPVLNRAYHGWKYRPYGDILRTLGETDPQENWFSWAPINGQMQLVMYGQNLNNGQTLATFDSMGSFVGSNDATSLAIDTNIYKEGSGSLAFTIDPTLGKGKATIAWNTTQSDFYNLLQNNGVFKLYTWLPSGAISAINLYLITSSGNYYKLTTSTFDDGMAFTSALSQWKKVQFGFSGDTVVGSPNIKNITQMQIEVVEGAGFGASAITNFRIDDLYTVYPDYMDLVYLTSFKGTDSSGGTNKIFLTSPGDIPAFGSFVPDLIDPIAYRGAVILIPQLMNNPEFRKIYQQECEEIMNIFGKSWPRKRVVNLGRLGFSRPR